MTTATAPWIEYQGQHLSAGDEVKVGGTRIRNKITGQTGIVKRMLRKNVLVHVDGKCWRVPLELIVDYRLGDPANLPPEEKQIAGLHNGHHSLARAHKTANP